MRTADELVDAACEEAGHSDFAGDSYREGLEALLASAAGEARLNATGEAMLESQVRSALVNRLRVVDWHRGHPEVGAAPVERPLFVLGLPRTGTTVLSYLLDCDPAHRSLLRWEALASVPPPEAAALRTDPRVAEAEAAAQMLDTLAPSFRAIHDEAADGPTECVTLLGQDFRSIHFETVFNVPAYGAWHEACDMRPAYEYHRLELQVLQSQAPGRWCLKSPAHNLGLDALRAVYPDARFVMTHRDPVTVVASVCSLVETLSGVGSDADHRAYIARRWSQLAETLVERALDHRDTWGDDAFCDLPYRQLVDDPIGALRTVYDHAGEELTPAVENAMRAYLDASPQGRHGRHTYRLEDFGLDRATLEDRFARYRTRFADFL